MRPPSHPGARRPAPAFTLIELLVVISIIAVLVGLVATAGVALVRDQSRSITEGVLQSLDRALQAYIDETGTEAPPYKPDAYDGVPGRLVVASSGPSQRNEPEAYPAGGPILHPRHPDAAVFLKQAKGIADVDTILAGMPPRFLVPTPTGPALDPDVTPSVLDAWADAADFAASTSDLNEDRHWPVLATQIIYYVHPSNRLAQDLYGRCVNKRPYFFSAGPDGLYGTSSQFSSDGSPITGASAEDRRAVLEALKDNVYSYSVGPALGADDPDHLFNEETR